MVDNHLCTIFGVNVLISFRNNALCKQLWTTHAYTPTITGTAKLADFVGCKSGALSKFVQYGNQISLNGHKVEFSI